MGGSPKVISPELAIRIGDETNALHIFYVGLWYGLEVFIAFLSCLIVVPWMISFGGMLGDAPDPKSSQSSVTKWIKERLSEIFGPRGITIAAKAVTAVAATGLALASVGLAAGEQPSIITPLWHESEGATGAQGEKGAPGTHGDPANPASNGTDGKDAVFPSGLEKKLEEQARQIQIQASAIESLKDAIVHFNPCVMIKGEPADLRTGGTLDQKISGIGDRVDILAFKVNDLTSMNRSMMASLEQSDSALHGIAEFDAWHSFEGV